MIRLDYETRSRVDLKKVGVWRYAQDKSTEILCFAYRIDGNPVRSWRRGEKLPADLVQAIKRGDKIKAFNANFELAITLCCGAKLGLPVPALDQWCDTQAVALMLGLPAKLETLAEVLKLEQKKDKEGARLINKFSKPQRNGRFIEPEDAPEDFNAFIRYCKVDVLTEEAADLAMPIHDLGDEQKVWEMDSVINRRGIPIDKLLVQGALKIEQRAQKEACEELTALTKNHRVKITAPGQVTRFTDLAKSLGYKGMPDTTAETIIKVLKDKTVPRLLRACLLIRQRTAQAAVKKYAAALYALCSDSRIRSIHRYHGAHTGRWTAVLLQTQNLARAKLKLDADDNQLIRDGEYDLLKFLYGQPMSVLRDAVRHIISAMEEHKLLICDLSSIEARVLGWLASDPKYLKAFREGLDLYIVTAAEIFGKSYADIEAGIKAGHSWADDMRWVGKQAVLALGYSMGVDTFYENCIKYKPDIKRELLERAVRAYRKAYVKIVGYWGDIESAAIKAIAQPGKTFAAGAVSFKMVKGYLAMVLPSGRSIYYPEAKLIQTRNKWNKLKTVIQYKTLVKKRLWVSKTTYGGRLTENAVQAIARDVLVHGMMLMEARGLPIIFHVHDEVIAHAKKSRKVEEVVACQTAVPKWAKGMPLNAKGFESTYYRKAA